MVRVSKESRETLGWCVEAAIGLIFDIVNRVDDKITHYEMRRQFRENSGKFIVSKQQVNRMLYELKRNNYIGFGVGDSVVLTNKAKIKIIDRVIEGKRKDGKIRIVSFDIPELKRSNRDGFRRVIKQMGFRQIQKSLWACEHNLGDLVEDAANEHKVSEFVAYFVADKSNIDMHIAKVLARDQRTKKR